MVTDVDVAVIGGGQAGLPIASALAEAGRTVALIERRDLGGSCVNFGCTPSKAVIASATRAHHARSAAELGVHTGDVSVDFGAVMDRARRIVADSRGSLDRYYEGPANPRLIRAEARLDGRTEGRIRVVAGAEELRASDVVVNVGTRTAIPPIAGLDEMHVITSENWMEMTELPRRVAFLGGGTIALEMAQAFRRFGADVSVLEQGPRLAAREDPEVSDALWAVFEAEGIAVRTGTALIRATPSAAGVGLTLSDGPAMKVDALFVATGRQVNTGGIGLETLGVEPGRGGVVRVDERLRAAPGLWVAGDARGGPQFTHTSYDDFRVLRSQLLGDGGDTTERVVPYAVFTDPELGRVGMTEHEARSAGHRLRVGRYEMASSGKARELGNTTGFIKVIVDAETDTLLGAAALCEQGAEVVQTFTLAMVTGATCRTLVQTIAIHPTLHEAAKNAVLAAR